MAEQSTSFKELTAFLNELFQFESADLDFGIYRILHYKRAEIGRFVNDTLPCKVQEQLQTLTADDAQNLAAQIADLEKKDTIKGWISAPPEARPTLEQYGNGTIAEYKRLKQLEANMRATEVSENDIYNHLRLFFSRYYDKGDFISKRRFGKNEKYVVPYNGEETFFHWANRDQYYIKSSENFKGYSFRFPTPSGSMAVHFKLTDAEVPQGNVKADEARYFILSTECAPEVTDTETTFHFQYRALTAEEKDDIKGNSKQDTLNQAAFDTLKAQLGANHLLQPLWQVAPGKEGPDAPALLLLKLNHYTKKNSYDFFIHKDLKGFLDRELDFYIKTELVKVDDLYTTDTDAHYERLRLSLRKIKAFKAIAETIITLLAQIEDFQKKLWEKKKFVIGTEWVITVDRLVQYVGEDTARPLLEQVVKNAEQVAEWRSLYGEDIVPKGKLTTDSLKTEDGNWLKLAVDTKHFKTDDFKSRLLGAVSEKVEIEEAADGLLVETDNYHGLQLLRDKFDGQVNTIYIDPPYNSGSNDFLYKDSFRNSSWLSMLTDRVSAAREFLAEDGLFFTSIDDKDDTNKVVHQMSNLLELLFGKENYIENVIWVKNTTHNDAKTFSHNHEYIQAYTKNKQAAIQEHDMFRRAKPGYTEVKELVHRLNEGYPTVEEITKELREL